MIWRKAWLRKQSRKSDYIQLTKINSHQRPLKVNRIFIGMETWAQNTYIPTLTVLDNNSIQIYLKGWQREMGDPNYASRWPLDDCIHFPSYSDYIACNSGLSKYFIVTDLNRPFIIRSHFIKMVEKTTVTKLHHTPFIRSFFLQRENEKMGNDSFR